MIIIAISTLCLMEFYTENKSNTEIDHIKQEIQNIVDADEQCSYNTDISIITESVTDSNLEAEMTEVIGKSLAEPVVIGDNSYIGYIDIPSLNISVPIIDNFSYSSLKKAPCRQSGSIAGNDLVIAGHNYKKHLLKLKDADIGDSVTFTDTTGNVFKYIINSVEMVDPTDTHKLDEDNYDLAMYTCTSGGHQRYLIKCTSSE